MKAWLFLFLPMSVAADCVLHDRTVTQTSVTIAERRDISTTVVPTPDNQRRCMVTFRARVNNEWHTAHGSYDWPGDRSRTEACAIAMNSADDQLRERIGRNSSVSQKVLICSDNPDLRELRQTNPGKVGKLTQFRPHPDRARQFWHNGAQCRYFLDSNYVNQDIRTWEGIICDIGNDQWVVVDKF